MLKRLKWVMQPRRPCVEKFGLFEFFSRCALPGHGSNHRKYYCKFCFAKWPKLWCACAQIGAVQFARFTPHQLANPRKRKARLARC